MALEIFWTSKSFEDIASIYNYLAENVSVETAEKIIDEIYNAPNLIQYPEQFQKDEYREDCRMLLNKPFDEKS